MVGGLKFYDRKEIRDAIAYLRVVFNPLDTVSLMRIINVPKRGIGDTTLAKLDAFGTANGLSLFDVISSPDVLAGIQGVTARVKKPLELFSEFIFNLIGCQENMSVHDLIEHILAESGYIADLEHEKKPENETRIENLKEFLSVAKEFEKSEDEPNLENFLSQISLVADIDNADMDDDRVTLMTLHSAKGLEFPIVFMSGMEEGLFPHSRTLMNPEEIEEERRTCYVGITRAQRKLYMTNARGRMIYGRSVSYPQSRFLAEIPEEYMERLIVRQNAYGFANSSVVQQRGYGAAFRPSMQQSPTPAGTAGSNSFRTLPIKIDGAALHPDMSVKWSVGDKAKHGKWGIGTIVSVKGVGEEVELKIAFPGQGIKGLMQKYAPISKI